MENFIFGVVTIIQLAVALSLYTGTKWKIYLKEFNLIHLHYV